MCEQCFLNPLYFGEFLPGFYLGRARRNGWEGKQRNWFLVRCNDPDIYWRETPKVEDSFESHSAYYKSLSNFVDELAENELDLDFSYELVQAAIQAGVYNKEEDGRFTYKLYDLLAAHIEKTEPETEDDDDSFDAWEEQNPTDLTIGKE